MILDNKPNKPDFWKEITLWRFNKITGFWSPVRVCKQATAKEWLEIFRRDEPTINPASITLNAQPSVAFFYFRNEFLKFIFFHYLLPNEHDLETM